MRTPRRGLGARRVAPTPGNWGDQLVGLIGASARLARFTRRRAGRLLFRRLAIHGICWRVLGSALLVRRLFIRRCAIHYGGRRVFLGNVLALCPVHLVGLRSFQLVCRTLIGLTLHSVARVLSFGGPAFIGGGRSTLLSIGLGRVVRNIALRWCDRLD